MENIMNFITNNSGLLITIGVAILGLIGAIISKNKQKIYADIYVLVCEAEQLEEANTDKFGYVFDLAYNKLPRILKLFISKDDIARAIEYSLNKIKAFTKEKSTAETGTINVDTSSQAQVQAV